MAEAIQKKHESEAAKAQLDRASQDFDNRKSAALKQESDADAATARPAAQQTATAKLRDERANLLEQLKNAKTQASQVPSDALAKYEADLQALEKKSREVDDGWVGAQATNRQLAAINAQLEVRAQELACREVAVERILTDVEAEAEARAVKPGDQGGGLTLVGFTDVARGVLKVAEGEGRRVEVKQEMYRLLHDLK